MKQYYECHVTFVDPDHTNEPDDTKTWAPRVPVMKGWKYSRIDGDPTLGAGVKAYLTRHCRTSLGQAEVVNQLKQCGHRLMVQGYKVLRLKVELVVFDERVKP